MTGIQMSAKTVLTPRQLNDWNDREKVLAWNGVGAVSLTRDDFNDVSAKITPYGKSKFVPVTVPNCSDVTCTDVSKAGYIIATSSTFTYTSHSRSAASRPSVGKTKDGQTIVAVAAGDMFFAVGTSDSIIYIYSSGGQPLQLFKVPGAITSMAASGSFLFFVSGHERCYEVIDVYSMKSLAEGKLGQGIAPNWSYIDGESGTPYVIVDDDILMSLQQTGWTRRLRISSSLNQTDIRLIPVRMSEKGLLAAILNKDELPKTEPFPDLHCIPYRKTGMLLSAFINYENKSDKDEASLEFDQEVLKQYIDAMNKDRLLLSVQLGSLLKTEEGRRGAIQYADEKGRSNVSQRLLEKYQAQKKEDSDSDSENEPPPFKRTVEITEKIDEEKSAFEDIPESEPKKRPEPKQKPKSFNQFDQFMSDESTEDELNHPQPQKRQPPKVHKPHERQKITTTQENTEEPQKEKEEGEEKRKKRHSKKKKSQKHRKRINIKKEKAVGIHHLAKFGFE